MTYRDTSYRAVRLATPESNQAAQVGVLDYAASETLTITGSSQAATALPAGCYMARISNPGGNLVRIRGDDAVATAAAPPLPGGQSETFVCTAASRVFRFLGTADDVVTITPYLIAETAVTP